MATKKRKSRRKRKKKSAERGPASIAYNALVIVLFAAIVYLGLSLYGVFAPQPSREGDLSVLVLNGCGVEGVGLRTAKYLRTHGYDVVDFRNADHFGYEETIVIDRTGDLASARSLARLLRIGNVIQQVPETPLVDIKLIVGKDYERFLRLEG